MRRWYCYLLAAWLLCLPASAHRLDEYLQASSVSVAPGSVQIHLTLSAGLGVARQVWSAVDTDGNGTLSDAEQQAYARQVLGDLSLDIDGGPQPLALLEWSFPARADVDRGLGQISLNLRAPLAAGAGRHHLRLVSRHRRDISVYLVNALLPRDGGVDITRQRRSVDQAVYDMDFSLGAPANANAAVAEPPLSGDAVALLGWTYFKRGLRHILAGYDHLLFAAALVLAARSLTDLVKVATAFTLAHSLTLLLATYQLVSLPASLVEPMIAASIVIVAGQNVFWPHRASGSLRLAVAFFFGLFHGLGFAGGLPQLLQTLDGSLMALAVAGFSLGVEAGHQLVMLPLLLLLRQAYRMLRNPHVISRLRHDGSALIAACGACYLYLALFIPTGA